jgi:hypothetical protein
LATSARYALPDRLRTRAGSVGKWVHVVGSVQRIFCHAARLVLAAMGVVVLCTDLRSTPMMLAILPLFALAWLGYRHGDLLEAVGSDLSSLRHAVDDPHAVLEHALAQLCSALLLEAVFAAVLSIAVAAAVVLA